MAMMMRSHHQVRGTFRENTSLVGENKRWSLASIEYGGRRYVGTGCSSDSEVGYQGWPRVATRYKVTWESADASNGKTT